MYSNKDRKMITEMVEQKIDELKQKEEVKILFICSGNIMRSPFAEYRARQLLDSSRKNITFKSGGVVYRNTSLYSEKRGYLICHGLNP